MSRPVAIVYTSNTGFTARYAAMLARLSGIPAYDLARKKELPPQGSPVLMMGWMCAGAIKGLKEAAKRYDLRGVCAVGMAVCKKEDQARLAADNKVGGLPFFYLRGGYAPEKLSGVYRLMMKPMARMVEKAPAETEEQRALRDAFAHGGDWVSQEALSPVLDWLSSGD